MKKFELLTRVGLHKPRAKHFNFVVDFVYNKLYNKFQSENHVKAVWRFVDSTVYRFFETKDEDE
jgi:hypothetical protein